MLRSTLIILSALLLALGLTFGLYREEVDQMIDMIEDNAGNEETVESGDEGNLKTDSIQVDTSATQLVFACGAEFTAEGLKVTVVMNDGSTKEVPLTDCKIVEPDMSKVGKRQVVISYGGFTARYEVTISAKVLPPVSDTPLVELRAENGISPYRVEAELIDMAATGVVKLSGVKDFVSSSQPDNVSGGKYLTGFGVNKNYFGFTFTADKAYDNATIVLRVYNPTRKEIDAGILKMYLNFTSDEWGNTSGEIPLDGYIVELGRGRKWVDIALRNLSIAEGTNVLSFEVQGSGKVFDLDYIDIYAGSNYVSTFVELTDTAPVIMDIEKMDVEKSFTNEAAGKKPGELWLEHPGNEKAHGGTSVASVWKGSRFSTTLRLAQDATVCIRFKACGMVDGYRVKDNWKFCINSVKITTLDDVDIGWSNGNVHDWKYTNIGMINLPAGEHYFMFENIATDCNVDTVEFEVVSMGSFVGVDLDEMDEYANIAKDENLIASRGTTKVEMENLDLALSDIFTRSDFIPAVGEGNVGKSGGRIFGYDNGTTFRMKLKVTRACTLQISLAGYGTSMSSYTYKFADQALTPQGNYGSGQVAEGVIGTVEVTEPGVYVFEFTSGVGCDLDYVAFTVVE